MIPLADPVAGQITPHLAHSRLGADGGGSGRQRMKIAFVHQPWSRVLPGKPGGSVQLWTEDVARRLARDNDVYIYSRRHPGLAEREVFDGVTYVRIDDPLDQRVYNRAERLLRPFRRGRSSFSSSLFYPQFYRRAARDMAQRGIDIAHVHSFPQAASIIHRVHPSARIAVQMHVEWLNLLPPRVARRQVRHVDLILGVSDYLSEQMRRALPECASRIATVYNAVDIDRFTPADHDPQSPPTVLFVGRISPEKGIHVLLDACARVAATLPDLRLDIIGNDEPAPFHVFEHLGDPAVVASLKQYHDTSVPARFRTWLRSRYPRRLRRLKDTSYATVIREMARRRLPTQVRFLGFVANNELATHYRRAQVVCLPSLTETFGIPLIEAMACGIPTIASRAGGIPELVDHGVTGLLVPVFDVEVLSDAIETLMKDAERRRAMGHAARQRVIERFSCDVVVSRLLELYAQALSRATMGA